MTWLCHCIEAFYYCTVLNGLHCMCVHNADIVMVTQHLACNKAWEVNYFVSQANFPTFDMDGPCSCISSVGKSPGKPQASLMDASLLEAKIVTRWHKRLWCLWLNLEVLLMVNLGAFPQTMTKPPLHMWLVTFEPNLNSKLFFFPIMPANRIFSKVDTSAKQTVYSQWPRRGCIILS